MLKLTNFTYGIRRWLNRELVLLSRLAASTFMLGVLLSTSAFAQTAIMGDAGRGKLVFLECQSCHAVAPGGPALTGPDLQGVYGSPAASRPGYDYSTALKASGITWNSAKLDAWIADPAGLVPGTKMAFAGIASPALRADVIAYLKTLK